jgi:hypothetical protein
MTMKKMPTQLESQVDWLNSEIEKDKVELERSKLKFIQQIKNMDRSEILPKPIEIKKLTLWEKIMKVITKS